MERRRRKEGVKMLKVKMSEVAAEALTVAEVMLEAWGSSSRQKVHQKC